MSQDEDRKDTLFSLMLAPFIFGGGLVCLLVLVAFSQELHINPKLTLFLAVVGYFFFTVWLEARRDKKTK